MFKPVSPKVDFSKLEEEILKGWYQKGIVQKYLHKNDFSKQKFSFLDGPITANNPMGVHHAWGRTYKDLWQRYWNMRGYKQRFQNGFDEQGLWVEVEVEKELGLKNKKDIENLIPGDKFKSLEKFINLCKERVKKFSAIQTEQSKRLGYFMDWDNSYHTSSDENNYAIWNFLKVVNEKGWLYKGRDSVPWCPRCGTAISQHEILSEEYKELAHETVFFKLPVKNRDFSLLVWTTTPWTIPANVAVAVNPKFKYRIWEYEGNKLIIVSPDEIRKKDNKNEYDTEQYLWYEENIVKAGFLHRAGVDDILGSDLIGLRYNGPFDELEIVKKARMENPKKFHIVIGAEDVVVGNKGTGLLHVAPGAGEEDFKLAKEHGLPVIAPIEEDGSYVVGMGKFTSKNAKRNPEEIIEYLQNLKSGQFLHAVKKITHRYPTCWRCKTELVWRVVDEWYIAMDRNDGSGKTYREQMVEVAKKIDWLPAWGLDRELDWLKNMHDWLISKKRYWGLALPIWECQKCGNVEVIGGKGELREKAIKGWNSFENHSPHRPWVDEIKIKCGKCKNEVLRIADVGNPWLDAGIVPFSTMPKEWFPAEFITESFPGQFKNWFYSLIAMSTALRNVNSFKTVLGFASVRDEKGEEMHKSKGNAIEFNEAAQKIGADVMRWIYVTQNPEINLNFGYGPASETKRRFYLILWNCYKFFVDYARLSSWNCKQKVKNLELLDKWILAKLTELVLFVNARLEKYDAMSSSRAIEEFIVKDFSTWYIRRSRDRVSISADEKDRNTALSVMYGVLVTLSKLMAPFTPFITEEIFRNLTDEESVHLEDYPKGDESLLNEKLVSVMEVVRELVEMGHAKRKELGIKVRQPLSKFKVQSSKFKVDEELITLIKDELNVKRVEFVKGKGELTVEFDTKITKKLKEEGEAREIIRSIQEERKKLGTKLDEKVDVFLNFWPMKFEKEIKRKALVHILKKASTFKVTRIM